MRQKFHIGIDTTTLLALSSDDSYQHYGLAITDLPSKEEEEKLKALYIFLSKRRTQPFFFLLQGNNISKDAAKKLIRFFFLPNYIMWGNSPLIAFQGSIPLDFPEYFRKECFYQSIAEPIFQLVEEASDSFPSNSDFVLIPTSTRNIIFELLASRQVPLEWFTKKVICETHSRQHLNEVIAEIDMLFDHMDKNNPGLYTLLSNISYLEGVVKQSEMKTSFLEIELANQKLYNKLIRGGELPPPMPTSQQENIIADSNTLKAERSRLLEEIGRLRNQLFWYKNTYENRSILGILKQKLFTNSKKK